MTLNSLLKPWEEDKKFEFLSKISISHGARELMSVKRLPNDISCLHGLKVLSTLGIVVHHAYSFRVHNADTSLESYRAFEHSSEMYALTSFTSIVDTFFVISAALFTRSMFRDLKE